MPDELELRCFCARCPLLGVAGRDAHGQGYVHVKSWKGQRLYTELIVTDGEVRIRCRECFRWHVIRIVKENVSMKAEPLPDSLSVV